MKYKCNLCKKMFIHIGRPRKFCSYKCCLEYRRIKQLGKVHWQCKQCGKQMFTFKSRVRDTCSNKCSYIYFRKKFHKTIKCKSCKKEFDVRLSDISIFNRRYCSKKCASIEHSKRMTREGNPNWKNGSSRDTSRGANWKKQSAIVRKRDNYTCQSCGKMKSISVHHIIPYRIFKGNWKLANIISNLITLCPSCHAKIEHNIIPCPKPKA